MDWFIKSVLYRQSKLNKYMPEPKLIIGHNLPFDLGAISNRTVKSRDPKFYGALSIGMCRCFERPAEEQIYGGTDADEEYRACGYHPNIRIKKTGGASPRASIATLKASWPQSLSPRSSSGGYNESEP